MYRPIRLKHGILCMNPRYRDPRVHQTLAFMVRKGFVHGTPWMQPRFRRQLLVADVLWTCAEVVPELYEVVPAAVLRFPNDVAGPVPDDLATVIEHLRRGDEEGPGFAGLAYWCLREWTDFASKDRRVSKRLARRVSFRLPARLLGEVRRRAVEDQQTQTSIVAAALEAYVADARVLDRP